MNQPPSRHPLFVAIACIALVGAWSTGAHEAETGESVALLAPAEPTSQPMPTDCQGLRGPSRALCLFEATRLAERVEAVEPTERPQRASAAPASTLRVTARHMPTGLIAR